MRSKEMNEVYWLRVIACLSVVLIHAVSKVISDFSLTGDMRAAYRMLQMVLLYGTPMFVLISTIVMTHAYQDKIPKGFLVKRVKYILVPYLIMALFYSTDKYVRFDWTFTQFVTELGYNIIGQWHGYFVLIIFQFYLLHLLFVKYMKLFRASYILTGSFLISVGYWGSFYFYWIEFVNHSSYMTLFFSRIVFVGWFFYYVMAYYCGQNYERFKQILQAKWKIVLIGTMMSLGLVQWIYHSGVLMRVTSARFDLIPYTVFLFFFLFYVTSELKAMPRWVVAFSGYSYGIYLLHPFVQTVVTRSVSVTEIPTFSYLIIQFVAGLLVPIGIIYILSHFPFGACIVGKTGGRKKTVLTKQSSAA